MSIWIALRTLKATSRIILYSYYFFQTKKVETFGSMKREEKVHFILEQMRLCIAKKDFVKAQIVSKKINIKFFSDNEASLESQVCNGLV